MRLYELAREFGVDSKVLLDRCRKLGLKPLNRLAGLTAAEVAALRKELAGKTPVKAAPGAVPKPPAASHAAPTAAKAVPGAPRGAAAPEVKHPPAKPAPPAAKPAPAGKPAVPVVPPKAKLPGQEEGAPGAARKRRRSKGGSVEDDLAAVPPQLVLGRYVPPSAIPRYPRRSMRHQRPKGPRRPPVLLPSARMAPLTLQAPMSVKNLSAALGIKANVIILKLMQLGAMANINAMLDAEQIEVMAKDLGFTLTVRAEATAETALAALVHPKQPERLEDLQPRAPVVTFLGHVDHGKTSLLDRIRKTDVAAHEHGGITQHIGANRVVVGGKAVVFLDTPGHEAFTAMRARGANVTDIAALVVAADDGVMPQTEEAIDHARAAGVPIVVALNKCDKPEANPTRVKQQLAKLGLQAEEWGGDTVCVEVSAVTGKGIDDLVEMLALVAELKELKANPAKAASGTVLEANVSSSRGPTAMVLVQDGTLRVGDVIVCGSTYGRVKALFDDRNRPLHEAAPSWPVAVVGLSALPQAGDRLIVLDDIQRARSIAEERERKARDAAVTQRQHVNLENLFASIEQGRVRELLLIVKGDNRGTLEALSKVLSGITSVEVKLRILRSSVGGISVSDVLLADASDAIIVGLSVVPDTAARNLAEQKGVAIHTYNVIYRVKEEIERALVGMLTPEEREVVMGHAEVRKVFKISRVGAVAGCYVTQGVVGRSHRARLIRDGAIVHAGRFASLRREKEDVREVREGFECGIRLESYEDVKVGDVIQTFQVEKVARTLGSEAPAKPAAAKSPVP